jgi:plasmid maintenance system antidote protein VapI
MKNTLKPARLVSPQTAISLSKVMGTSLEFWWNLETSYRFRLALAANTGTSGKEPDPSHSSYDHSA